VISAPSFTPPLAAAIVATPSPTAVTRPLALTVATVLFDDDHTGVLPVITPPAASRSSAVSCSVSPTKSVSLPGSTVTLATGSPSTVTCAVPLLPPAVAVMVVVPSASAVTRPVVETEAKAWFDEDHVTVWPATSSPLAFFSATPSWTVSPTWREMVFGITSTVATVLAGGSDVPPLQPAATTSSTLAQVRRCAPRRSVLRPGR
jgi:hypothetical protein